MTPQNWLDEGDARPDYDYSRVTWLCGFAVLLVDQKLYVVQWSCKISTASAADCERPGEDGSPHKQNFAQRVGVWLQMQCLCVVPFLCFGSLWGSSVNIYSGWMNIIFCPFEFPLH